MKRIIVLIPMLAFAFPDNGTAMGVGKITLEGQLPIIYTDPFSGEHDTDETPDSSTTRYTFQNDTVNKCWRLRATVAVTGSLDLVEGTDATIGTGQEFELFMFGATHPEAVKCMVVHGANLMDVVFDYSLNTIRLTAEPVKPARTASHNVASYTAGFGIDFYYSGESENLGHGPPVISTDAFLDDVSRPAHPSSANLIGKGIRIDGLNDFPVNLKFTLGSRYMDSLGLTFNDVKGYRDGVESAEGLTFNGPNNFGSNIDLGGSGETFQSWGLSNVKFSAVDIQVGTFPEPLSVISFSQENDGFHIIWNSETGKTYTVESTDDLGIPFTNKATSQSGPEYIDATATGGNRYYRIREE